MCTKERWQGPEAEFLYEHLLTEAEALLSAETDWLANLANASALVYSTLPDLNWAGFYLHKGGELVLGPFQGKPACVRIAWGRGVCGTAAERQETVIVPDVHQFPGHIACDPASRSEIVVPILQGGNVWGVLDIDSPYENRFSPLDQQYLERLVELLNKYIDWQAACSSR
ncbi:MAG TPA: GAF domain-containing protein [Firmicutes bacterium]|nr:GAF domain-containing protein [Bacillota bacterium]